MGRGGGGSFAENEEEVGLRQPAPTVGPDMEPRKHRSDVAGKGAASNQRLGSPATSDPVGG